MREIIRAKLMQYLNDNGAATVCKTHLDKMTDAIVDSLKENALLRFPERMTWLTIKPLIVVEF